MDRNEAMINELEDLESRINFLQEVQAQEQGDEDKDKDSPSWPTITSQM